MVVTKKTKANAGKDAGEKKDPLYTIDGGDVNYGTTIVWILLRKT